MESFPTETIGRSPSLADDPAPQQAVDQFAGQSTAALDNLIGVGGDLGAQILASVPAAFQEAVKPLIPAIVQGIHQAFSLAVSSSFQIGVVTTILALVAALAMHELPLRSSVGPEARPSPAGDASAELAGRGRARLASASSTRMRPCP